jgi:DNA (cytosine-5)-methyltransferase 1
MSGDVSIKKRLISITQGNIKNSHIYITGHHDFFPCESFGASNQRNGVGKELSFILDGFSDCVYTDISTSSDKKNPRNFFRKRGWISSFFKKHNISEGDVIAIEKIEEYKYKIYPFDVKKHNNEKVIPDSWSSPEQDKFMAIDLFAGCGGFSYGLKQAGFENLLAIEWDTACCDTFRRNISPRILNCAIQEVRDFPHSDLLVGGPPCQGFSNLGEKLPNDPRRQLWRYFMTAVEISKPLIFIMENVPPILKSAEYVEIVNKAKKLGYEIEGRVLNAADYGAPQQRKRAIIIASRIGCPVFPEPTNANPDIGSNILPPWKTVKDAIGDLPPEPDGRNWHIGRNPTEKSIMRYKCVPLGGNRFDLPPELTPDCWKRKKKGGTDLFGRLWWNRPSVTIRTEFYKPEKGRYLHPVENRPITHREAARLQGFDDNFMFEGTKIEVGIQIGNAVPPPLAYRIGLSVKQELREWFNQHPEDKADECGIEMQNRIAN